MIQHPASDHLHRGSCPPLTGPASPEDLSQNKTSGVPGPAIDDVTLSMEDDFLTLRMIITMIMERYQNRSAAPPPVVEVSIVAGELLIAPMSAREL